MTISVPFTNRDSSARQIDHEIGDILRLAEPPGRRLVVAHLHAELVARLLHHRRLDRARMDGIAADGVLLHLAMDGDRLGHGAHGALGRAVREEHRDTQVRGHRGHVDDRAAAARMHRRESPPCSRGTRLRTSRHSRSGTARAWSSRAWPPPPRPHCSPAHAGRRSGCFASATTSAQRASSRTSCFMKCALPASAGVQRLRQRTAPAPRRYRSPAPGRPRATKVSASARPRPEAAPVMMATLPARRFMAALLARDP